MGVYVKGMEMPKPKFTDITTIYDAYVLVGPNGHAAIVIDNEDGLNSTEYPLVPIPPHGEWYGEADGYADGELVYDTWSCGCCGKHFPEWDEKPDWNYCPNCGANMREAHDGI